MAHHSASFSLTLRVRLEDRPGSFAELARAIGDAGGDPPAALAASCLLDDALIERLGRR